jgi:hypothetical protein
MFPRWLAAVAAKPRAPRATETTPVGRKTITSAADRVT